MRLVDRGLSLPRRDLSERNVSWLTPSRQVLEPYSKKPGRYVSYHTRHGSFAQCVIVVVIGGHIFRSFVPFVEKGLRGNVLRTYSADPADGVVLTIRHTHWRSAIEADQNVRSLGGRGRSGRKACRK